MPYYIQKKTPATNWHTIHRNLEVEVAKEWLIEISKNYDADQGRSGDSSMSEDGLELSCYEGGDLHEFRILEEGV